MVKANLRNMKTPRPAPTTPGELRAKAERMRETARLRAQQLVEDADREAAALEMAARMIEQYRSGLPSADDVDTIGEMDAIPSLPSPKRRRSGPVLRSTGPIADAARELGISVHALAKVVGENSGSMRTWGKPDRRPPDDLVKKLDSLVKEHRKKLAATSKAKKIR